MFYADLHIHSKFSRATSRTADLEHMALWARKKGVSVLGTGDFTHPAWLAEIQEKLIPAEPGLFRLRDDLDREVGQQVAGACHGDVRFMLQVEISTIYKKGDRTRKVHHLIYAPDLDKAQVLIQKLSRIGNLKSDGRPILGLDSRDLLEITLESGDGCYLVPAHIWTPWFAVLGSKSGFDSVQECYGDLSHHIFALETGLSSDPPMNWRLSALDGYQLVSNSDAHSPPKIGREACAFETDMDYFAMRRALETGDGYAGTVEFFPEEGKYHLDGHRKCDVRLSPSETRRHDGLCPVCGKNLTVGVMNRVDELADRPEDYAPGATTQFRSFVPLPEVIAEIRGVGEKSKKVQHAYEQLIAKVGSELFILEQAPTDDLRRIAPVLAEAITRMRQGDVIREAGYDGEYGRIRLFDQDELKRGQSVSLLFDLAEARKPEPQPEPKTEPCLDTTSGPSPRLRSPAPSPRGAKPPSSTAEPSDGWQPGDGPAPRILDRLDVRQRTAAEMLEGPVLIVAGPGTGKTRTLTHRIAHLVADHGVAPEQCLAITFSRRAAREMSDRLVRLLAGTGQRVAVMTFHALGLHILREHGGRIGLPPTFQVAGESQRRQLMMDTLSISGRQADRLLGLVSRTKRGKEETVVEDDKRPAIERYQQRMREEGLVDFDDLIVLAATLLQSHAELAAAYRSRWPWVSVDEYQDIDEGQCRLVQQMVAPDGNLCVIGDPDQSIYGFRGANVRFFQRFTEDYPSARTIQLSTNYRSSRTIVDAALQVIRPSSLVTDRMLDALSEDTQRIEVHTCPTDRAEAEFVVHSIERLMGGTTLFSLDSGRVETHEDSVQSFGDFAVLYRTDVQADVLSEAFTRSGIPFQKKSHRVLADDPAVQALIGFLRRHLQSGPAASQDASVVEVLKQAADAVWDEHPEAANYLTDLHPLASRCGRDVPQFLSELAMGVDVDLWDPRADRVSLLTLHASKGLEFPVVFLVGCEDGLLPFRWGPSDDRDIDEERRLFFVGITRAQDRLFLSHAKRRHWRGQVRDMQTSPFLQQIQEELLDRAERAHGGRKKRASHTQLELF